MSSAHLRAPLFAILLKHDLGKTSTKAIRSALAEETGINLAEIEEMKSAISDMITEFLALQEKHAKLKKIVAAIKPAPKWHKSVDRSLLTTGRLEEFLKHYENAIVELSKEKGISQSLPTDSDLKKFKKRKELEDLGIETKSISLTKRRKTDDGFDSLFKN